MSKISFKFPRGQWVKIWHMSAQEAIAKSLQETDGVVIKEKKIWKMKFDSNFKHFYSRNVPQNVACQIIVIL